MSALKVLLMHCVVVVAEQKNFKDDSDGRLVSLAFESTFLNRFDEGEGEEEEEEEEVDVVL